MRGQKRNRKGARSIAGPRPAAVRSLESTGAEPALRLLHPSRREFRALAREFNLVPVWREILADCDTPVSTFLRIGNRGPAFLMESVEGGERVARYSFTGADPRAVVTVRGGRVETRRLASGTVESLSTDDPLSALRDLLRGIRPAAPEGVPPFHGGLVGYLAYDAVRSFERLPDSVEDSLALPDAMFLLTDTVLGFDRARNVIQVVANVATGGATDPDEAYDAAGARMD